MEKTHHIGFDQIIEEISYENNIEKDSLLNNQRIIDWYENVYNQIFLKKLTKLNANEIIINNAREICLIFHDKKEYYELEGISIDDFNTSLELLAYKSKQEWNYSSPFTSFHLELFGCSYRCSLVNNAIKGTKGHQIFLRKLSESQFNLIDFVNSDLKEKFQEYIDTKKNIIVAGSTGSGKTTFLNSLIREINPTEHIVCLEDTKEISLKHKFGTRLLANGNSNKKMKDYCSYALRMSPDRIILGEIRSQEVVPMVLAMNTGHNGFLTSIHANSATDSLNRLALLFSIYSETGSNIDYEHIYKLICSNIDVIVFVKNKRVSEIIEVIGCEKNSPIYNQVFPSLQEVSQLNSLHYLA